MRDGGIIVSPAQKYISYGLCCGLVTKWFFKITAANEGRNRVGCGFV